MQIRTIRKGFEAFEWKFEPFERDSKHSNPNSNRTKGIRSIRIQIRTIRKGLGLGLGLGPWLGPSETTQKQPFLPKNGKRK